jgi:hypothetical protein
MAAVPIHMMRISPLSFSSSGLVIAISFFGSATGPFPEDKKHASPETLRWFAYIERPLERATVIFTARHMYRGGEWAAAGFMRQSLAAIPHCEHGTLLSRRSGVGGEGEKCPPLPVA